jgi:hypothetical protein
MASNTHCRYCGRKVKRTQRGACVTCLLKPVTCRCCGEEKPRGQRCEAYKERCRKRIAECDDKMTEEELERTIAEQKANPPPGTDEFTRAKWAAESAEYYRRNGAICR